MIAARGVSVVSDRVRRDFDLLEPQIEIAHVEPHVMAEPVMRNPSGARLGEQPGMWHAEKFARGLGVEQRLERRAVGDGTPAAAQARDA
ncbi:MAG TPA: hypothetical protein VMB51_01485 [Solirubrobacteraceae bacterium]|nr:hypothetical protein [Solirubrobacteraceae bacterium]